MTSLSGKGARRRPLWDIPTRVFHWTLVCLLPLAWWSADQQRFEVHQWVGYTLLVLVLSRVLWGIVGSRHSRFADFLVGPAAITRYVQGGGARSPGHNPLGGWSHNISSSSGNLGSRAGSSQVAQVGSWR